MSDDPRPDAPDGAEAEPRRRPLIERIGMAGVALVMAALFGGVALAAWIGPRGATIGHLPDSER